MRKKGIMIFLLISVILITGFSVLLPPSLAQGTTHTISVGKDSYVDEGSPTSNYGSATTNYARDTTSNRSIFIYFDISSLSGSSISWARLEVPVNVFGGTPTIYLFKANDSWNETDINWNNAPGHNTSPSKSAAVVGGATWSIIITDMVSGWISGIETNYGFVINATSGYLGIVSKESGLPTAELKINVSTPPIPGFEMLFVLVAISSLIIIYVLIKNSSRQSEFIQID